MAPGRRGPGAGSAIHLRKLWTIPSIDIRTNFYRNKPGPAAEQPCDGGARVAFIQHLADKAEDGQALTGVVMRSTRSDGILYVWTK
jgi:hypothetical protein